MQDFIVMSDESIDIKIDLEFVVNTSNSQNINVIQEIDVEENGENEKNSIIIYFVKKDDTLWKIAKRFKSTVSAITKINDIEDENKLDIGEQLFIPMSI
jgi:LysM repeat protein